MDTSSARTPHYRGHGKIKPRRLAAPGLRVLGKVCGTLKNMSYCNSYSLVKCTAQHLVVASLKCKTWGCPECKPARLRELRWYARRGRPDMFLTLTCSTRFGYSRHHRAQKLKHAFAMLRQAVKRRWRVASFPFIAVFEEHESGEPHLHILCRMRFIPQKWISKFMRKHLGSPVVDVRRITSQRAAINYVTKYIADAPARYEHCKRYWSSHDWLVEPAQDAGFLPDLMGGWRRVPVSALGYIHLILMQGWRATFDGVRWLCDPPDGGPPWAPY
jgi:hypothetical protein